jgi:hypothetical protein
MPLPASPISIPTRWISVAAFALWLLFVAAQMAWLPLTQYAWAYNLWAYFPDWAAWLAWGVALSLCLAFVREGIVRGAHETAGRFGALPARLQDVIIFIAVVSLLWVMRERMLIADSWLLYNAAVRESWLFVFPDVGSTFFMRSIARAEFVPLPGAQRLQLAYCLCGGLATMLAIRVARRLSIGTEGGAAIIVLLLLTSGVARLFAGHVESYSVALCGVLFYFWMALAFIDGDVDWWAPCVALGVAGWLHLSALFLVPSIVLLPWIASPGLGWRPWIAVLLRGAPIAIAPMIAFWLVAYAFGYSEDLERGFHVMLEIAAGEETKEGLNKQWWVRIGDEPAEVGLDYVFLSRAHLKYLANAAHVLMPFSALIIGLVVARFRPGFDTPACRLLIAACIPTMAYAFMLRPFWGPYDWDLFAITAFSVSLLAGHLLLTSFEARTRAHVATWLLGFQILFVGLPFLVLGVVQPRDGGPFIGKKYLHSIMTPQPDGRPIGKLVPWL